jgi:hypothetical protein
VPKIIKVKGPAFLLVGAILTARRAGRSR